MNIPNTTLYLDKYTPDWWGIKDHNQAPSCGVPEGTLEEWQEVADAMIAGTSRYFDRLAYANGKLWSERNTNYDHHKLAVRDPVAVGRWILAALAETKAAE